MVTLQQIFDKAWQAFIVEGKPPGTVGSKENGYGCQNVTPDGRRCAIGLSLPNEFKDERATFWDLPSQCPGLFAECVTSLTGLQRTDFQFRLHDGLIDDTTGEWGVSPEDRLAAYQAVAKDFGLTIPKITLQSIFNAAWQAFIVEGQRPAAHPSGACCYLTGDGRRCAVGQALPCGHPAQDFKGGLYYLSQSHSTLFDESVVQSGADRLNTFQSRLHDSLTTVDGQNWCASVGLRREMYLAVAKDYGLEVPVA